MSTTDIKEVVKEKYGASRPAGDHRRKQLLRRRAGES